MLNRVADRTRHPFRMRMRVSAQVGVLRWRSGLGIWLCQATGSAKARVTAAVRLERFSRR